MEKIIQENNKKLNRFGYNNNVNDNFNELIIEELEFDLPETQQLEEVARKALGRTEQSNIQINSSKQEENVEEPSPIKMLQKTQTEDRKQHRAYFNEEEGLDQLDDMQFTCEDEQKILG